MPTYEYACVHCGHKFDALQKMSDKPLSKCPKCGHKVQRLIGSGVGVIFKGSGFYATDYKKTAKTGGNSSAVCPKAKEGCDGCKHK